MKISYSILTHNETDSLDQLLGRLFKYKDPDDEIVVVDDYSDNEQTIELLETYSSIYDLRYEQRHLMSDFAGQKNYLRKMCTGDFIFNIDADELPTKQLIGNLKSILETNPNIDLVIVPRINTVDGLTDEHIKYWGWQVNDQGWVNFPDWQPRIHRNRSNIRWTKPVHEIMEGYSEYSFLPTEPKYCLRHHKTIDRQEKQNAFYSNGDFWKNQ
jgi:glycosyltransferase involved in cell wall biosynthesis|tara:strand:+ start:3462 stop:4100 length:639 start_codon:yes stop_codon:yes gene_type:complete